MTERTTSTIIDNRYEAHEVLGSGGMGLVYRAKDLLSGRTVALKQVTVPTRLLAFDSRADHSDPAFALAQEFRALATMRHPHIISVYDFGFDRQGQPYFTMEHVAGGRTVLEAGQGLRLEAKVELIIQMLQALVYLHRRGILHRDIKPSNALVLDGQLKLLDFGLSVITSHTMEHLTHTTAGTMAYMAPELFQGAPYSKATDLYAIGVIAFELLTGQFPYRQNNLATMMNDVLSKHVDAAAYSLTGDLANVVNRLLTKSPEARYQEAGQVIRDLCAATGSSLPPETDKIRESFLQAAKFVGREAELSYLNEQLQAAVAGQGALVLIGGESGVGKSRLLEELRTRALVEGVLVFRGQAVSSARSYYQVWQGVLREALLHVQPDEDDLALFLPVVPDLKRILNRSEPKPKSDPQSARIHQQQLARATIRLLGELARPAMILLEDLQWAGTESLGLLSELASRVIDLPVLLVGAFRDDWPQTFRKEIPQAEYVYLSRLTAEDIAKLSESMLGRAGRDPIVIELLQRETEGNAFFLVETVRALAEEAGRLDRINVTRPPQFIMPRGIQAILERRLSRVPKDARPLMQLASVAGRVLDLALLREMEPEADFEEWLTTCTDVSVLEAYGETWRFSHDKLREAIKEGLSHHLHHELHRRVAEGIEATYPESVEYAAALAHHWLVAGDREKELHYTIIAAEQAVKSNAYEEAIMLFERALDLLQTGTKSAKRNRQELALQMGLGSQLIAFHGLNAPSAKRAYTRARELAIQTDQIDFLFQATFGQWEFYCHNQLVDLVTAEELLGQLFDLAGRSGDKGLLLEAHHAGWGTAWAKGDAVTSEEHIRLGLAIYDRQIHQEHARMFGHDPGVCAHACHAVALWLLGYPDRALQSAEKGIALARVLENPLSTSISHWGSTLLAFFRGEDRIALQRAKEFAISTREHTILGALRVAEIMQRIAIAQTSTDAERMVLMHEVYGLALNDRNFVLWTWVLSKFLEACLATGSTLDGLQAFEHELADNPLSGKRPFESEVRRLYGELILAASDERAPEAEEQFRLAGDIARRQGAKSLELRVTMSLAQLRQNQGRPQEARQLLAEAYGWFSEGFDTADLTAALNLLDKLAAEAD